MSLNREDISISIHDDWPKLKLIISDGRGGTRIESSTFDTALVVFEPLVRNVLQAAIQRLTNIHKRGQQV